MNAKSHLRRAVIFFCLAALLLAALTPGAGNLPVAILVPLMFFIAIVASVLLPHADEQSHTQQVSATPAFSPRPPPAL
jgi:membrane-bound metal-dependent hydrolase YbcI (DUF457 family)